MNGVRRPFVSTCVLCAVKKKKSKITNLMNRLFCSVVVKKKKLVNSKCLCCYRGYILQSYCMSHTAEDKWSECSKSPKYRRTNTAILKTLSKL